MTAEKIQELIDSISNDKNTNINNLSKSLLASLIKQLNDNINTKGGKITNLDKSAGAIISSSIDEFTKSEGFKKSIQSILSDIGTATNEKVGFYKDADLPVTLSELSTQQKLAVDEFLDSMSKDGLNAKFNQTLRTLIYENIRNGVSQTELQNVLEEKIISGKAPSEMAKYIKGTVQQAADAYTKVVDQQIYNKFKSKISGFRVIGSLIETSSPQCRQAVEKYKRFIPIDELDKVLDLAKSNGLIEGTNESNLATNGLHWSCRHQFLPIINIKK
jgi:hypothetical protein